jgi:hypothetical protein
MGRGFVAPLPGIAGRVDRGSRSGAWPGTQAAATTARFPTAIMSANSGERELSSLATSVCSADK